jgi:PAS domain S-box-containing protein
MPSRKNTAELENRIAALEKELAESQACLDIFGVSAPAGLGIFDRDCRYVRLNQTLADFANRSIAEHIGNKPSDLLPGQLAGEIETVVQKILATGKAELNKRFIGSIPGGCGPDRHWLATLTPLRTSLGEIRGVGVIVVEETNLQQLRQSLSQQEALQVALLETIPARIFMKDCAGSYVYCNDIFVADVGLTKDEIIGKTDFDLFRPEMAERYRQADLQVISSGLPQEFEYQFEKNGREYFVLVRKTPFRNTAGNILGILGMFHDLTDEKQTERQLRIADHALEATLAGIAIADPVGRLTYVNRAFLKMWGFEREEEALGRSSSGFWDDHSESRQIMEKLQANGDFQGELTGRRLDGTTVHTLLAANLINDVNGRPLCIIGSFVDITARKAAERKLRDSEEQLRQIAEHIDDALWIIDKGKDKMLYVSPAYEKIWGLSRESLYRDARA